MADEPEVDFVLELLPDHVIASMEVRDRFINDVGGSGSLGLEFLVDDVQKWRAGQIIKVAFLGGSDALCREVAEITKAITDACNIKLDFGAGGAVRRWSEADTQYTADIRVTFDKKGYFSLVGTDSINATIGAPSERVGGRPHQCSLNLGGFTVNRPPGWQGTVLHEFLHALAFHHEHQNMRGGCESEFRWDDDQGYEPTTDLRGTFIRDAMGRLPGIYTYLAGPPNSWNRMKVDHNLRPQQGDDLTMGTFDRASIMLYRFPAIFYKSSPSPCAPIGEAGTLSDGDRLGLLHLYPFSDGATHVAERQLSILKAIRGDHDGDSGLETTSAGLAGVAGISQYLDATAAVLARNRNA